MTIEFRMDELTDSRVVEFLKDHIDDMKSVSPPESKHALDLDGLRMQDVTFWSAWNIDKLIGCGALKELDASHAEIKSMRITPDSRRRGYASMVLSHLLSQAALKGYTRLSLETGSMAFFEPARRLYEKYGFIYCPPFGNYKEDPNSIFMSLELAKNA